MKYREYLLNTHLYMFQDIIISKMYRHYVNTKSSFQTSKKGAFLFLSQCFRKKSKFNCNENLFFKKVIGKFRLDLVHFTKCFSILCRFFLIFKINKFEPILENIVRMKSFFTRFVTLPPICHISPDLSHFTRFVTFRPIYSQTPICSQFFFP